MLACPSPVLAGAGLGKQWPGQLSSTSTVPRGDSLWWQSKSPPVWAPSTSLHKLWGTGTLSPRTEAKPGCCGGR